ncbi:MAG TPA: PilZ domain-containing protein [Kofleriaceae bacterium]|nr:PilZ domain-containing protein [Kofleriaceae bacterium]
MSQGNRGAPHENDRRRHFRAGVSGGAVVHGRGGTMRGHIRDLSLGGALIELHHDPSEDEDDVLVELEIGTSGWVAQRGQVARRSARHVAIAFGTVPPDVEDVIEDEVVAAVEARKSPRVVVCDPREDRRHQLAEKLRAAGTTPIEARTPLEAIALVEQQRNHVVAVAMADTLTQTGPHELVDYLSESNPHIRIAMFADDAANDAKDAPHVQRHGTSDELASSLAETLRRDPR